MTKLIARVTSTIRTMPGLAPLLIAFVAVAIGASALIAGPTSSPDRTAAIQCNVVCLTASVCGSDFTQHKAPTGSNVDQLCHGSHSACSDSPCHWYDEENGEHPQCQGFAGVIKRADYDRLKVAVARSDVSTLRRMLRAKSSNLVINARRQSIQVAACDRTVLANLPLSAEAFGALVSNE